MTIFRLYQRLFLNSKTSKLKLNSSANYLENELKSNKHLRT